MYWWPWEFLVGVGQGASPADLGASEQQEKEAHSTLEGKWRYPAFEINI